MAQAFGEKHKGGQLTVWLVVLLIGLPGIFLNLSRAQDRPVKTQNEQVVFNVSVTTREAEWIKGLAAKNFQLYDEKKSQTIGSFVSGEVPASVGVLIDQSGSTTKQLLTALPAALKVFIEQSDPSNDYFFMSFDVKQDLLLDTTQDTSLVKEVMEKIVEITPKGNTRLYDSIKVGMEKLAKANHKKRSLIIFTDTMDNTSTVGNEEIKKLIQASGVLLYTVNVSDLTRSRDSFANASLLIMEDLTRLSGGKYFLPDKVRELNLALVWIATDLRNQYQIGFTPQSSNGLSKKDVWRKVEINVELPSNMKIKGKATVRTRRGYFIGKGG